MPDETPWYGWDRPRDRRLALFYWRWARAPFTGFRQKWEAIVFWLGVLLIAVGKAAGPAMSEMGLTAEGLLWQVPLGAVAVVMLVRAMLWPAYEAIRLEDSRRGSASALVLTSESRRGPKVTLEWVDGVSPPIVRIRNHGDGPGFGVSATVPIGSAFLLQVGPITQVGADFVDTHPSLVGSQGGFEKRVVDSRTLRSALDTRLMTQIYERAEREGEENRALIAAGQGDQTQTGAIGEALRPAMGLEPQSAIEIEFDVSYSDFDKNTFRTAHTLLYDGQAISVVFRGDRVA